LGAGGSRLSGVRASGLSRPRRSTTGRGREARSGDASEGRVENGGSVWLALAGGGDLGLVGHGGDGTEFFRRLAVGHDGAVLGVDTREVLIVTLAGLEGTVLGVVGSVVGATDTVETMLAEVGGVGVGGIANLDTEGVTTHEAISLVNS
jgi:hypothetical protein